MSLHDLWSRIKTHIHSTVSPSHRLLTHRLWVRWRYRRHLWGWSSSQMSLTKTDPATYLVSIYFVLQGKTKKKVFYISQKWHGPGIQLQTHPLSFRGRQRRRCSASRNGYGQGSSYKHVLCLQGKTKKKVFCISQKWHGPGIQLQTRPLSFRGRQRRRCSIYLRNGMGQGSSYKHTLCPSGEDEVEGVLHLGMAGNLAMYQVNISCRSGKDEDEGVLHTSELLGPGIQL